MTKKITIEETKKHDPIELCLALEEGNILFFPDIPFNFSQEDRDFLLNQKQKQAKHRKNIAYKPQKDRVSNYEEKDKEKLTKALKSHCYKVNAFLSNLLLPYKDQWILDYTSFRPYQEKGRDLRLRARNDLLHLDAFPTRPMNGKRILRFFTNINPQEPREWITGKSFSELIEEVGPKIGFPKKISHSLLQSLIRKGKTKIKKMGCPVSLRSPYDEFMLKFHHYLKENEEYQQKEKKDYWSFSSHSCWAVFTDQVTHAALSGQYALEQTFLIPRTALIAPEKAPISILERLTGYVLTN